jgi:hypothetical protein
VEYSIRGLNSIALDNNPDSLLLLLNPPKQQKKGDKEEEEKEEEKEEVKKETINLVAILLRVLTHWKSKLVICALDCLV